MLPLCFLFPGDPVSKASNKNLHHWSEGHLYFGPRKNQIFEVWWAAQSRPEKKTREHLFTPSFYWQGNWGASITELSKWLPAALETAPGSSASPSADLIVPGCLLVKFNCSNMCVISQLPVKKQLLHLSKTWIWLYNFVTIIFLKTHWTLYYKGMNLGLPWGPVAMTPCSQRRGSRFKPWSGN